MKFRRLRSLLANPRRSDMDARLRWKRQRSRLALSERLEDRRLLAGPELLAIRPDASGLLQDGDVLHEAPREFNLYFRGGANLDPDSITPSSVRLIRSGGDGAFEEEEGNVSADVQVALGYVGLVDPDDTDPGNLQQVVIRPASNSSSNPSDPSFAFPDDVYRIEVVGVGDDALANQSGERFADGSNASLSFRLDRGAQVVSVVPQPVTRQADGSLSQATDTIEVHFDDQLLNRSDAEDPGFYRLVDTSATLSEADDVVRLPATATYDDAEQTVTLAFAEAIPEGTYRLDVGRDGGDNDTRSAALRVGTLFDADRFDFNGYLGNRDGQSDAQDDVDMFRLDLPVGVDLTVEVTPHADDLALEVRVTDGSGATPTLIQTQPGDDGSATLTLGSAGPHYIEVGSLGGGVGGFSLRASVTGNPVSVDDDNSTFETSTELGTLGAAARRVTGRISPQPIPLPPHPGGTDEPGHRDIQKEVHIGSSGTTPTVPSAIRRVAYRFPSSIGGFPNQITQEERRIVRGIFEIMADVSGYEFVESTTGGLMIGKTDLRAFDPSLGPDSGVAGLGGGAGAIVNAALYQDSNRVFGDGFTSVMWHEIAHSLGLGHSYELPSLMGQGTGTDILLGDHDRVHLQRIVPPNSTDIDLYRFEVAEAGTATLETFAERLPDPSLLNTVLTVYREAEDGSHEIVARNDRYFGNDSWLELSLEPGVYFVGVSSTGNDDYDPNVPDSGFGGTTDGDYELQLSFRADRGASLRDADGTAIDGGGEGTPGGTHSFWFQAGETATTIFVDRANDSVAGTVDGDGSLADPYDTLRAALTHAGTRIVVPLDATDSIEEGDTFVVDDGNNQALFTFGTGGTNPIDLGSATTPDDVAFVIAMAINTARDAGHLDGGVDATVNGRVVGLGGIDRLDLEGTRSLIRTPNLVRVVGNGGADGELGTPGDNLPYLVGTAPSGAALRDGREFLVPQGTTVMVDAGALIKMRRSNLDAGTSAVGISRAAASIQVLGTPEIPVWLRSYHDDAFGGDSDGTGFAPESGDFGGIVFREDSDLEQRGVFLNHVTHVDIEDGGGTVRVGSVDEPFAAINMFDARPTVRFNRIASNDLAAMLASPNSFDDSLGRIGPQILGNFLVENSINGLFVRIRTEFGASVDRLTVPGRFASGDIPYVLTENLLIEGNPGGPLVTPAGTAARAAGRLVVDPGVVVKLADARIEAQRGGSSLIAEGTDNRPVVFTSLADDRFGGGGTFDTGSNGFTTGSAGDWGGVYFGEVSSGSFDRAQLSFAGGQTPIEGDSASFNAIEIHEADVRIANSLLDHHADGNANGIRNGRGANRPATIYVRGAQPILVDNTIVDNAGPVISINANSLNFPVRPDRGRSTGELEPFAQFEDNHGPLIRLNRLEGNAINGVVIRGEELTTEGIWDDTDIVHVLRDEIVVDNHHTFSGLRLQSGVGESLIVKLSGGGAGITATGTPLETVDRIGGTVHVMGTPGHPVILTDLADDTVGAGFAPDGSVMTNTNNSSSPTTGSSGGWRGLRFEEFSNDRNVAIVRERERPITGGRDINRIPGNAQLLGELAPDEKGGDENRRLGFEVHGYVSPDDPGDVDVYSFRGTAGTPVWIDLDRTDPTLDVIVELLNENGTVQSRSIRSGNLNVPGTLNAQTLTRNPLFGGDFYTQNFRDAGMFLELPGTPGVTGEYFVRVRSNPVSGPITSLQGKSSGKYQLQVRLRQVDEFPGSTVQFADIRFAETAIDVRGLPARSPLVGEASELPAGNSSAELAQVLVNLLETDTATLSIAGELSADTDVDFYRFEVEHTGIQVIPGANDDPGTVAVVFDLDYADGLVRPDSTVAVFDASGNILFVGRESNVDDDLPVGPGVGTDDLSRGSFGVDDPFIGPVHVRPNGPYFVAVMSDRQLPSALTGVFRDAPATASNASVRLEPINTVRRVVEDHIGFQGYRSIGGTQVTPETDGIFDVSSATSLESHVVPFRLEDVSLFVATDATFSQNNDHLFTVNPFRSERYLTRVTGGNRWLAGQNDVQDIEIRSDGRMFGVRRLEDANDTVGALVELDPATGAILSTQNDNIPGRSPTPNVSNLNNNLGGALTRAEEFTTSDEIDAFTFRRTGTSGPASAPVPDYHVYYAVREADNSSKLYRGRENGDASPAAATGGNPRFGNVGDIQRVGVAHASTTLQFQSDGDDPDIARVRVEAKVAGPAGDAIRLVISRPDNTNASVTNVFGNTIFLNIGADGPTVQAIVDAINGDEDARELVTAVIVGGNDNGNGPNGTVADSSPTGTIELEGGAGTPLDGYVTGLSFGNFFGGGPLFGVTTGGEFLSIERTSGTATVLNQEPGVRYTGLTLGPQNVNDGQFARTLFAVTAAGEIHAYDTGGNRLAVFEGGAMSASTSGLSASAVGLTFSPLDFNLWHPTLKRGADDGHGIESAPDDSRVPEDNDVTYTSPGSDRDRERTEADGGMSLHFGFEDWSNSENNNSQDYLRYLDSVNAQYGILNETQHADLSSNPTIAGTYNFPGGALGSLQSSPFSLAGSGSADRPTLYFNYFLETENHPGSNTDSDVNDPFRDSARVFVSADGGASWNLVATNNSRLSDPSVGDTDAELAGFVSHRSDAGLNSESPRPRSHQIVQELFDNTGQWRQARIDLSDYAGQPNVRLRFDFSTAGAMRDASLGSVDSDFGEFSSPGNDPRSIRSLNNAFEGIYIDDILVGYAERGEMVTGVRDADATITDLRGGGTRTLNRDPDQFPDVLSGPYQLEIRRADDVAALVPDEGIAIVNTFDTNVRHVDELELTAEVDFEPGVSLDLSLPGVITVDGMSVPDSVLTPWEVSDVDPIDGTRSLRSGELVSGAGEVASVYHTDPGELGSTDDGGGLISFTYRVRSAEELHGLMFLIDGVPQLVVPPVAPDELDPGSPGSPLASGDTGRVTVRFPFQSGDSTFTWVYNFLEDQDQAAGENRAWIDDIQVLQGGTGFDADRNRDRQQGVFVIDSNVIRDSGTVGVNVQPGSLEAAGGVPHPAPTINFAQRNDDRLIPGVVIQNNLITGSSAIRFAGEPTSVAQRPVPFGRIVNNTLVGDGGGSGVQVVGLASPTLLNNIITGFGTGIGGATGSTVVRSNHFQDNGSNGPIGTDSILAASTAPLFIDAAADNYILDAASLAVDSSLNTLQDRFNYVNFKDELAIPPSPMRAPDRDLFGQLRVDSSSGQSGGGSQVFKDRGAIDLADQDRPYAVLRNPVDNDQAGLDRDPNATVVWATDSILEDFRIFLGDGRNPDSPQEGTGVDPLTVTRDSVEVRQNGRLLVEGVDYVFAFNASTREMRLTPLSTLWEPSSVYDITLDNNAITDRVGKRLRGNREDGSTAFTVILPDVALDFGDAPASYGTLLVDNGARHAWIDDATPRLGTTVDREQDGQPFAAVGTGSPATGGDDLPPPVRVTSTVDPAALLVAGDGTDEASLRFLAGAVPASGDTIVINLGRGPTVFEFVPVGVAPTPGNLAVRFDPADSPDALAAELHTQLADALLGPGDAIRVELDPDDNTTVSVHAADDEDGVAVGTLNDGIDRVVLLDPGTEETTNDATDVLGFLNPLDPAGARVAVEVAGSGFLDVWIDFDGDGSFHPSQERVMDRVAVNDGWNVLTIHTPPEANEGETYARFRLSPEGGLLPTGLTVGGEVEDHVVEVISVPLPVPNDDRYEIAENSVVSPGSVLDTVVAALPSVLDSDTIDDANFTPIDVIVDQPPSFAADFELDPRTGHFRYQPLPNFVGIDTFTYRLANQAAAAETVHPSTLFATVSIDVRPVNDPPLAQDQSFTTREDTSVTVTADELLQGAVPHFDPLFPVDGAEAPFDESNQSLRVVSVQAGSTTVTAANADDGPFPTENGVITATFDQSTGWLVELAYLPNTDLNRDNADFVPFGSDSVFDRFDFTIEDDGVSIDPATFDPVTGEVLADVSVSGTPRTHVATAVLDVSPQNDDPVAVSDYVSVGTIGAGVTDAPVDPSTDWGQYLTSIASDADDVTIPVPTEDEPLVIPAAFLLRNDESGRSTAADEVDFVNDNDGPLTVVSVEMVTPGDATVSIDEDGNIVFVPPTHEFGEIVFRYVVEDQGVNEEVDGTRVVSPLTHEATVTVMVQPVNDRPVGFDRSLRFDESSDPGASGPYTFTPDDLLLGSVDETPARPGPSSDDFPFPFDESEQSLRAVRFRTDAGAVDVADLDDFTGPGTGNGTLSLASDAGGTFEFDFVDGAFVEGRFVTSDDYNERTPFATVERLFFTIEDDGLATDPQTGEVVTLSARRAEEASELAIHVTEANDAPVFEMPELLEFDENEGEPVVVSEFLFDVAPGPFTALDELERQSIEISVDPINVPDGMMTDLPAFELFGSADGWVDGDGNPLVTATLTVFPAADAFGFAVYQVTLRDDDPDNPREFSRTVTIAIHPVNDAPAAFDRAMRDVESVEADGETTVIPFDADRLILGDGVDEVGSVPGVFPDDLDEPYNEQEQSLRVVRFEVPGADPIDVDIDEPGLVDGSGEVTRTTPTGATLTFLFDSGAFVSGTYEPATDYNERTPFDPTDTFTYVIKDDGQTTLPGSGFVEYDDSDVDSTVFIPELRSESATVTFTIERANDPPVFDFESVVHILERDDNGETVIADWATEVLPGPETALDELQRQSVSFEYVADASDVPAGLFQMDPLVSPDGTLSVFPSPDAVGTATIVMRATDFEEDPEFVPRSTEVTFTIDVQPVNDPPRIAPDRIGESDALDSDTAYAVGPDGTVRYTLREDNTQADASTTEFTIPLRRDGGSGFDLIGLLDVFEVGPANEASDDFPGGSQVLSLEGFEATTALGGTVTLAVNSVGDPELLYAPPQDYNRDQGDVDFFEYTVIDESLSGGETYQPGGSPFIEGTLIEDRLTAANRVEFELTPVNDRPEFELATTYVEAAEDTTSVQISDVAIEIVAGPSTASDERSGPTAQSVSFEVIPIDFVPGGPNDPFGAGLPQISSTGELTFEPLPDAFGRFEFGVRLIDSGAGLDTGRGDLNVSLSQTLTIEIRPVNDPPVRTGGDDPFRFDVSESDSLVIPAEDLGLPTDGTSDFFGVGPGNEAADLLPQFGGNQSLDVVLPFPTRTAEGGTLEPLFDNGGDLLAIRYTPRPFYNGSDSFVFAITDDGVTVDVGTGGVPRPDPMTIDQLVTFNVIAVNDPPVFDGAEDVESDEDAGPVTFVGWAFDVAAAPEGADDERDGTSAMPPQSVEFVITQVDGDPGLFVAPPTAEVSGQIATLRYETATDANGTATFEVYLQDDGPVDPVTGDPVRSDVRTFTVTVNAINDPPQFTPGDDVTVDEDSGPYADSWATDILPGPVTAVDELASQAVTFDVVTPVADRWLFAASGLPAIDSDGVLTFTPADDAAGTTTVIVTPIDSEGLPGDPVPLVIEVIDINDPPIAVDVTANTDEDRVLRIRSSQLTANDIDPDLVTDPEELLTVSMPPESFSTLGARLTFDSVTGELFYDPLVSESLQAMRPGETLVDSFTYTVEDSQGEQDTATVVLNVAGRNDAPVTVDDSFPVNATADTVLRPLNNDFDVDGTIDPTSIVITRQPEFGSLTLVGDGTVTYTPFSGFSPGDFFRYTVADDFGQASRQATVTLEPGTPPTANDDLFVTMRGETVTLDVLSNDLPQSAPLVPGSVSLVDQPSTGQAVVNGDGTINFTAADEFVGVVTLRYTVTDENGLISDAAMTTVNVIASTLQNPSVPSDVNADGKVSALDALIIINRLNASGGTAIPVTNDDQGPNFYDQNGDGRITPIDALGVINALSRDNGGGEGESGQRPVAPPPQRASVVDSHKTAAAADETRSLRDTPDPIADAFDETYRPKLDRFEDDVIDLIASRRGEESSSPESERAVDEALTLFDG